MTLGTYEILTVILNYANSFRNYRLITGEDYPEDSYEVLDGAEHGLFYLAWEICEQNEFDFFSSLTYLGLDNEDAKSVISRVSPKPVVKHGEYYNGYNLVCHISEELGYHLSTSINSKDELTKCWYQGMSAGMTLVLCEFCEALKIDMLEELRKVEDLIGEEIYTHLGEAYVVFFEQGVR